MNKKNIFFLIIIFSYLFSSFSEPCMDSFFINNKIFLNSSFYFINAVIENSHDKSIVIYVKDKEKIRIDYNEHIIISDRNKTINYSEKTKQLFIEKSDSLLNDLIFSFGNSKVFKNKINNYLSRNNIQIYLNKFCTKIDSIVYNNHETKMKLKSIKIDTFSIKQPDLFELNIDESEVFIYDFR